ncbi:hypothetical protein ACIMS2_004501 [Vibrio harveyi]
MSYKNSFVLSTNNSDWGSFGSFVGGLVSPVFSIVSIIYIAITINENYANNEKAMGLAKKQHRQNHILSLISIFDKNTLKSTNGYKTAFEKPLPLVVSKTLKYTIPDGDIYNAILHYQSIKEDIERNKEHVNQIINTLITNVRSTLHLILKNINAIESNEEKGELLDLIEAGLDADIVDAILDIEICNYISNKRASPLLDLLYELNSKGEKYREEYATAYIKTKNQHENRSF